MFRRHKPEFTDGIIDLVPIRVSPPDPDLEFGNERVWRITLHRSRREIGRISYRDGESRCVYYFGHIGYHINPPWRGNHFARRACSLLRQTVFLSGKTSVVITCDPDNTPSRITCEHLGCIPEGIVAVPEDLQQKYDLNHTKCRYIWHVVSEQE